MQDTRGLSILTGPIDSALPNGKLGERLQNLLKLNPKLISQTAITYVPASGFFAQSEVTKVTFGELIKMVNLVATRLSILMKQQLPIESLQEMQSTVFVMAYLAAGVNRVLIQLACMQLNLAYIGLDKNVPSARLKSIFKDYAPAILIHDGIDALLVKDLLSQSGQMQTVDMINLCNWKVGECCGDNICNALFPSSKDPVVLLLFTSGSTSDTPKGVILRNSQLCNRLAWQCNLTSPLSHLTGPSLVKSSWLFVDAFTEMFGPLLAGRPIVVSGDAIISSEHFFSDVSTLADIVKRFQIVQITTVPSQMEAWLSRMEPETRANLCSLQVLVLSGQLLPKNLAYKVFECFPHKPFRLVNLYGSTEVAGDVTCMTFDNPSDLDLGLAGNKVLPVGRPISNTEIYVISGAVGCEEIVPNGTDGEICVSGAAICAEGQMYAVTSSHCLQSNQGSVQNTLGKRTPGFTNLYHTGDTGHISLDGQLLYVIGRLDDMVKVNGVKLHVGAIDQYLASNASISAQLQASLTLPVHNDDVNTRLVCFYIKSRKYSGTPICTTLLQQSIKNHFLAYINVIFVEVDAYPIKTQSGKIDKVKLQQNYLSGVYQQASVDRTQIQNSIVGGPSSKKREEARLIIAEYLGLSEKAKSVGRPFDNEDFYLLGGDSIIVAYIIADLRRRGFTTNFNHFSQTSVIGTLLDAITCKNVSSMIISEMVEKPFMIEYCPSHTFANNPERDLACQEVFTNIFVESFLAADLMLGSLGATRQLVERMPQQILELCKIREGFIILAGYAPKSTHSSTVMDLLPHVESILVASKLGFSDLGIPDPIFDAISGFFEINEHVYGDRNETKLKCEFLGVHPRLIKDGGQKSINLAIAMENEIIQKAKRIGCHRIDSVNTSPVTIEISKELGYECKAEVDFVAYLKERNIPCVGEELIVHFSSKNIEI